MARHDSVLPSEMTPWGNHPPRMSLAQAGLVCTVILQMGCTDLGISIARLAP
jgi:hypothetical protein